MKNNSEFGLSPLVVILGATATGKTRLAVALSLLYNGEIISADSRQVYKGMDIGTGKDLSDYKVDNQSVDYHLIDIATPGEEFNLYRYKVEFDKVLELVRKRNKMAILCGGTGLYIEAALGNLYLPEVPINQALRESLSTKSLHELVFILKEYGNVHNSTDTLDINRCLRAIEIAHFKSLNPKINSNKNCVSEIVFGIRIERNILRENITKRLDERLENGMIQEVEDLLSCGVNPDTLKYYGLEYKFLTQFLLNEISYIEMRSQLNTSIHQFAKRQETYFRKMERNGLNIQWLEYNLSLEEKLNFIQNRINQAKNY